METTTNQVGFTKWELDADIPKSVWNPYMKKYERKFVTFRGKEGIWRIKCRFGDISPYSLKRGLLMFSGTFPTPSKKTYFLKKIKGLGEITQEASFECTIKFLEKKLNDFTDILQIRQRMKLSQEERKRRSELMKKINTKQ